MDPTADRLSRLTAALADRYAILREIGAGGMATVYLADDFRHGRKVALKVLRPELVAMLGAERFLNEIKITASLQHPHILPLYDSGVADGFLYYVMPYVEGESLRDRLNRERQLPVEEATAIAREVALALDFAHRRKVIHRDIKPENILLQQGKPLVADFGIALAVTTAGGRRITATGISMGTPYYMSPEQAAGDREVDGRSDIYSLGATLYEMLTGRPPFAAASAVAMVAKILGEVPATITAERPTVPQHVAAAVDVALAKLPADRFPTAAAFADALANQHFTSPTLPRVRAMPMAAPPWGARAALPLAGVALAAVLVAAWALLRGIPGGPGDAAVRRYQLDLPAQQSLEVRYGSRIAESPDGSRLVFVGPSAEGVQLWSRLRERLEPAPLSGTEGAATPFFSPDGQSVGFINVGRRTLNVLSLSGGAVRTVVDAGVRRVGASWSSAGLLYVDEQKGLVRLPEGGRAADAASIFAPGTTEPDPRWPDALPGGKAVLYTRGKGETFGEFEIAAVKLADGKPRVLGRGVLARYAAPGRLLYVRADGALMAAPFDPDQLTLTGPAIQIASGLEVRFGSVDFAASAGGTLAYGTGAGGEGVAELVWVLPDGAARVIDPAWTGDFQSVTLSPDGSRLAVTRNALGQKADIWIKQLDTGPLTRLTFDGLANFRPAWTADGRRIVFISDRGDDRYVYETRADGVGPPGPLTTPPIRANQAAWSRDGKWLIYRTGRVDSLDIYARKAGDTTAVPLVAAPSVNEHSPILSPDGRWLAFVSDESGRWEVYVRPFPNTGDGRWQVSTTGGTEPRWARSGRELFYKSDGKLFAATVQTTPIFAVLSQRALFSVEGYSNFAFEPRYDVAGDDSRFVMIRPRRLGDSFRLVVIDNWAAELSARKPN